MARTPMSGPELDRVLAAFADAQDAANNGKVLYIRDGNIAFEDGDALFDVVQLEAQT